MSITGISARGRMETEVDRLVAQLSGVYARRADSSVLEWVMVPLLRLLVHGRPVSAEELASSTGRRVEEIRDALRMLRDVELDDQGRVVGRGITLNPTPHQFTVDGRRLYTWCALDTLLFPSLIAKTAQVESPCHATGEPVRITVEPDAVTAVEPAHSVVSIVTPSEIVTWRSAFCDHGHFFADEQAATLWLHEHPEGTVLPVVEAFALGRRLAQTRFNDARSSCC